MIKKIARLFTGFIQDESGQDLIEYALVAGLIGVGAIIAMTGLPGKIGDAFNKIVNTISSAS